MTKLTKPVHRETNKKVGKLNVVLTIAPGTESRDDLIGLRLKGTRTQYVITVSDVYRIAAIGHANKERAAKAAARRASIPWRKAKKDFIKANSIQS